MFLYRSFFPSLPLLSLWNFLSLLISHIRRCIWAECHRTICSSILDGPFVLELHWIFRCPISDGPTLCYYFKTLRLVVFFISPPPFHSPLLGETLKSSSSKQFLISLGNPHSSSSSKYKAILFLTRTFCIFLLNFRPSVQTFTSIKFFSCLVLLISSLIPWFISFISYNSSPRFQPLSSLKNGPKMSLDLHPSKGLQNNLLNDLDLLPQ